MNSPDSGAGRGRGAASLPQLRGTVAAAVHRSHQLLLRLGFYPAAMCTLIAVGMLAARWAKSGVPTYRFMLWNLFLAWLPWLFSVPLAAGPWRRRAAWKLVPAFALWLLFLPNAPYMTTDLLHLKQRAVIPIWYDAALFFVFAWTGCLLAFHSLAAVHGRVEEWMGRFAGWSFVGAVCVLCGYGIYLGRFLRWNSWDLFERPRTLLGVMASHLLEPARHPTTVVVTVMFAAFLAAAYGSFAGLRRDGRERVT